MRNTVCSLTLVGMIAGLAGLAASSNAQAQATQPVAQNTILVLPFEAPSGASDAWVGKAVQQDLLTDLSQGSVARVLAPASAPAAVDQDAALGTARRMGASIVIYGQAQTTGKEVRLSGQVLDVNNVKPLTAIKSTGPMDELFHLEDALAGQVFMALPKDLLNAQTRQSMQNAADLREKGQQPTPGQAEQGQWPNGPYANSSLNPGSAYGSAQSQPAATAPQPQYVSPPAGYDSGYPVYSTYSEPTPVYTYNNYYYPSYTDGSYGYGYPSWGWNGGWGPFWGPSFFVFSGFRHHNFDHDHDHDGFGHHWNGNWHGSNGAWNHGAGNHVAAGNGATFAHSGFGAGAPRGNAGFHVTPRVSTGGFSATSRFGNSAFRSGGISGGIRGHIGGGAFHSAGAAGGFHGGGFGGAHMGGGMHAGGGMHSGGGGGAGGHR